MAEEKAFDKVVPECDFIKRVHVTDDGYRLSYMLYVPRDYRGDRDYPLLLHLHGAGSRGGDNGRQVTVGLPHIFDDPTSPAYGSFVVAPHLPEDKMWVNTPWSEGNYSAEAVEESDELRAAMDMLRAVADEYRVDKSRIYVMGPSMGGFGTWDALIRYPEVFAAGIPICGGGDTTRAEALSEIPIRAFHGKLDDAVPVEASRGMYEAICAQGKGLIDYTEFENEGHGIWDLVYSDADSIRWMYSAAKK